jgi:hypothetical protein
VPRRLGATPAPTSKQNRAQAFLVRTLAISCAFVEAVLIWRKESLRRQQDHAIILKQEEQIIQSPIVLSCAGL